jgi:carbon monoxide dehydrogenase subunit G
LTEFTARKQSEAVVAHERKRVWDVLVDPGLVASITPMVAGIEVDGDLWRWTLPRIPVLGKHYDLHFTERMRFSPVDAIDFRHHPRGPERAGAEGRYDLAEAPAGTALAIDLAITVDLPLPRLSRAVVQTTMHGVLEVMGAGFARGLERHLSRH